MSSRTKRIEQTILEQFKDDPAGLGELLTELQDEAYAKGERAGMIAEWDFIETLREASDEAMREVRKDRLAELEGEEPPDPFKGHGAPITWVSKEQLKNDPRFKAEEGER